MGIRDYALGYHPLFELAKCISRTREKPYLIGSFSWLAGFLWANLSGRKRDVPADLIRQVRAEQLKRLFRFWH